MARARIITADTKRARCIIGSGDINWSRMQQKENVSPSDVRRMHPNASIPELKRLEEELCN